ncbi:hypothetical protein [Streptomyces sp.]|uniref:hypothetical protein n=1 Tax=Streptomyces sp. TaxID=1931 RepID=UPI002F93ADB3
MTDVNGLYEVNDREPDEPEQEPVYRLDQIAGALAAYQRGRDPRENLDDFERSDADQAESFLLDVAVPQMLAQLREWEALPTREEWAVTGGPNFPDVPGGPSIWPDAGVIAYVKRHAAARLWRRMLSVHAYEPISPDGPF